MRRSLALTLVVLVSCSGSVSAQMSIRTVIMEGDAGSGCPSYAPLSLAFPGNSNAWQSGPWINNAGQVAFLGNCGSWGFDNEQAYSEGHGGLHVVASRGQPVSGFGRNGSLEYLRSGPRIDDNGNATFLSYTYNYPNTIAGFISDEGGSLHAVVQTGTQAPGAPPGTNFLTLSSDPNYLRSPMLSRSGNLAFYATTNDTELSGIWTSYSGVVTGVARSYEPVPGYPGLDFGQIGSNNIDAGNTDPAVNQSGDVLFGGWVHSSTGFRPVMRDPLPGIPPSESIAETGGPDFNNGDRVAFRARTYPSGLHGIWSESGGALHLAAREGEHAAGTSDGVHFSWFGGNPPFGDPVIGGGGRVAFAGTLSGPGVEYAHNDRGFWAEDLQGFLKLLVRTGMQAPGMNPGVVFDGLSNQASINALGQVLFDAHVAGMGISEHGVWMGDVDAGTLMPLVLSGQMIELRPGDFRTISDVYFPDLGVYGAYGSGGQDGRVTALNDHGQFAFIAQLSDGSSGIFVGTIPEPATGGIATAMVVAMMRRRRGSYTD